jgi:hypothetical protein
MQVEKVKSERENKAKTLSRILRINLPEQSKSSLSSSPDIELIKTLKDKIDTNNPLFRLTIEDFDLMCKNNMLFNMMVKVLGTDKKKLTKICKNINILKDNIDSSPDTIKNKMKMKKITILDLPDNVLGNIVSIYMKTYKLHDWIPPRYIDMSSLSANYNAMDFLSLPENQKYIDYSELSKNTNPIAIKFLKNKMLEESQLEQFEWKKYKKLNTLIDWEEFIANPVAMDYLQAEFEEYFLKGHKKDLMGLLSNTNPAAIQLLRKLLENGKYTKGDILYWGTLSANPSAEAFAFLQENWAYVNWEYLSKNTHPTAILLLEEKVDREMGLNLEQLDDYEDIGYNRKINWSFLSTNPKAVHLLEKKWKEEKRLMIYDIDKYNRLKELKMMVMWRFLSSNPEPSAIKLIKEKLKQEDELSMDDYNRLEKVYKIDWELLSSNPIAIKILSLPEYKDKIEYYHLSKNPEAIKLIKQKIIEEGLITDEEYKELEKEDKIISPSNLSQNPSIFII